MYQFFCITTCEARRTGIEHYTERLELGLFTRDEMMWTFESVQMAARYDLRALWVAASI